MIIVDRALQARANTGEPVRVAIVGAGFMGSAIARQISTSFDGMQVVAVANRTLARAQRVFDGLHADGAAFVESREECNRALAAGRPVVAQDPTVLCGADCVDVVVEATGTVEFAAGAVIEAIENGKHVVLVNAELDGTLGPALKRRADAAGVVYTNCDGDQPGAEMNLYRFVRSIGLVPVLCGSVKGLLDHYRTPETQREFAERWGQTPSMVTSFADGTKISFEQAVVGNATNMGVGVRGLRGPEYPGHVEDPEHLALYDHEALLAAGGVVDFVLGAEPGAGVYVLAVEPDERDRTYLDLYKLGSGPLYCFCTPYHLCYFEVPLTIARAALFGDAAIAPAGRPVVDVVATAKRDLRPGEVVDGLGEYMTYGQCENADVAAQEKLLPMGLAGGCRLVQPVARDTVLTYADVELPAGRLGDALRAEQAALLVAPI